MAVSWTFLINNFYRIFFTYFKAPKVPLLPKYPCTAPIFIFIINLNFFPTLLNLSGFSGFTIALSAEQSFELLESFTIRQNVLFMSYKWAKRLLRVLLKSAFKLENSFSEIALPWAAYFTCDVIAVLFYREGR